MEKKKKQTRSRIRPKIFSPYTLLLLFLYAHTQTQKYTRTLFILVLKKKTHLNRTKEKTLILKYLSA